MTKVLIADDEEKVCQLIYNLIDWQAKGMEVTGFAHNGIEALELLERTQPEIIITDIRMPGYDGLELIRRAKEIRGDLEFIIISGYRHFEYAKSAIKFGVEDYLLKPVNEEELNDTLDKLAQKKHIRMEQLTREEQLRLQVYHDQQNLRHHLFAEVIQQKGNERSLEEINAEYHYHMEPGLFMMFIVTFDFAYGQDLGDGVTVLRDKIRQITEGMLLDISIDLEIFPGMHKMVCLVNYAEPQKKEIRRRIRSILDELMVQRNVFGDLSFSIGCSEAVTGTTDLHKAWKQACGAADERLVEGSGKVLEGVRMEEREKEMNACLVSFNVGMESAMEVFSLEQGIQAVTEFGRQVRRIDGLSGTELLRGVEEAWQIYRMLLRKYGLLKEEREERTEGFQVLLENCGTSALVLRLLREQITSSLEQLLEARKQQNARPIREAMQYIQKNFNRALTLDEVSGVAGFNPTYFSTLFKKETGKNFQEYVLELRMRKTKDLLKETDMSVIAICEEVGYSDVKHFTKTFKKHAGINPNQYRKIYS